MAVERILLLFSLFLNFICFSASSFHLDDSKLGRVFQGIGGISGGGATSKLLVNYPQKQRDEILDYLFKPNFGASLHIFKVEIGGDSQSTDGTEASHMHNSWEENYNRGYEWWMMKEAKKRNPDIKLYGLPWAFPGWVGNGTRGPYTYPDVTAKYVVKWVLAAKTYHGLTIDYVGIWNERPYTREYVLTLRSSLDTVGLKDVKIVGADGNWDIASDILNYPDFAKAIDFIGVHYPGMYSTDEAVKTGKPLWSSEDYSTFNDDVGAGCWARLLNRNYVKGLMTSTISWNIIASYYKNLPYPLNGLMTAYEPWSANYVVNNPIWATAHTSQFTQIGWNYLAHGSGVGDLASGGSYVTFQSPDKKDITMVIEKMSHDHSICIRPPLSPYDTSEETAVFQLKGSLANITSLNVWASQYYFNGTENTVFKNVGKIKIVNGAFSLRIPVDSIFTLTTLSVGQKGNYGTPPPSKAFPLPYKDNFDVYPLSSEPFNLSPQVGSFEIINIADSTHKKVTLQTVLTAPIQWCGITILDLLQQPMALIGYGKWADIFIQTDVNIPSINGSHGAFVAARVNQGGCSSDTASGVFFTISVAQQKIIVTSDVGGNHLITSKDMAFKKDQWYQLGLQVKGTNAVGMIDGKVVFNATVPASPANGFVGFGTPNFGLAMYDNLVIDKAVHF